MQFDNAVVFAGEVIEAASQEQVKAGTEDKPEWKNRYTMKELLDPEFRLPINQDSGATKESTFEDFVSFFENPNLQGMKIDEVS